MSSDPALTNLEGVKVIVDIISGMALLIGGILAAFWAYTKFVLERGFLPPAQFYVDCHMIGSEKDGHLIEFLIHVKNLGSSALVVSNLRMVDIRYLTSDDPHIKYFTNDILLQQTTTDLAKIDKGVKDEKTKILEDKISKLKKKKKIEEVDKMKDEAEIGTLRKKTSKLGRLDFPHSLVKTIRPGFIYEPNSPPNIASIIEKEKNLSKGKKRRKEKEKRGVRVMPWDTFVQSGVDQIYSYATILPPTTKYIMIKSSFEYGQIPTTVQKIIIKLSRKLGLIQYSLTHLREAHTTESVFEL
jgi:hypothetical protein